MFADDTKIYRNIKDLQDRIGVQGNFNRLKQWSEKWLLSSSKDKCKVMHTGYRNPQYEYLMDESQQKGRIWGIHMTTSMSPWVCIAKAVAKANSILGRIKRTFPCMDKELFLTLYSSLVISHMEYAMQTWSSYMRKDIDQLEKVQRRATKLVLQLQELPYFESCHEVLIMKHFG